MQSKVTKAATESKCIATDKIAWTLRKLEDLGRAAPENRDARTFRGSKPAQGIRDRFCHFEIEFPRNKVRNTSVTR